MAENYVEITVKASNRTKGAFASAKAEAEAYQKSVEAGMRKEIAAHNEVVRAESAHERATRLLADAENVLSEDSGRAKESLSGLGAVAERIRAKFSGLGDHLRMSIGTALSGALKGGGALAGISSLAAMAGPLAAVGAAVAGFGALAAPTLSKVQKALSETGAAGQKAWKQLDPGERGIAQNLRSLKTGFDGMAKGFEPVVASVVKLGAHIAKDLEPAIAKLAPAGAKVITAFLQPLDKLLQSKFFDSFIKQMSQLAQQVAPVLGKSLTQLLKVFMQLFMQAGPAGVKMFQALLPALTQIIGGLVPIITVIARVVAGFVSWAAKAHVLIPVIAAVGIALAAAFGGMPLIIAAVVAVAGALGHLWQTSSKFRDIVTTVFSDVGRVVLSMAELWIDQLHIIANIWTTTIGIILDGAAKAFGWVPGVGPKLREAARGFASFKDGVNNVFNAVHAKLEGWKSDLAQMPKVVHLEGNIQDLELKLAAAKKSLQDPNLTKDRRAAIKADIADLEAKIARAKADLATLKGKTVYITTVYTTSGKRSTTGLRAQAHGGIIGAAGGGARSDMTLVGEQGPELLQLPAGSTVHSNPDTTRMLASGGGGVHVTMEIKGSGMPQFDAFMLQWLKQNARIRGGGNVQAAFGRS